MIRQFDICPNPLRGGQADRPFVLVVQHPFWDLLPTRVVLPLIVQVALDFQPRLNPIFEILGQRLHLSPSEPITLPLKRLRAPVKNISADRDRIVAALDLVYTGV